MSRLYVFVGGPEMVKAGKPFVTARGHRVEDEGVAQIDVFKVCDHIRFRTGRQPRVFRTRDGRFEYRVRCWAEIDTSAGGQPQMTLRPGVRGL